MAYTEAFQATGKDEYARTAGEVLSYVLRDMTDVEGGFYSAEDADSEGEEGRFYVWTEGEIRQTLTPGEADLAVKVFNVDMAGNYIEEATGRRTGRNILHMARSMAEIASHVDLFELEARHRLETAREKLFEVRERRVHPHKDDKILTDWNGLMIAALARAAQAFDDSAYAESAERAADFVLDNMRRADGRLFHRYRKGEAAVQANVDDYVFLIWGLIDLYETVFEVKYLRAALDLARDLVDHFWDDTGGGFYFTPDDGESLILRQKEVYDGAVPSGNSVAMLDLLRLGRMTANADFEARAYRIAEAFSGRVRQMPAAYSQLMVALDFALGPSHEVVVVGDSRAEDTKEMVKALRRHFLPNKVLLLRPTEQETSDILSLAEFIRHQSSIEGRATAYVCRNYQCQLPTTDIEKMLELLDAVAWR